MEIQGFPSGGVLRWKILTFMIAYAEGTLAFYRCDDIRELVNEKLHIGCLPCRVR